MFNTCLLKKVLYTEIVAENSIYRSYLVDLVVDDAIQKPLQHLIVQRIEPSHSELLL